MKINKYVLNSIFDKSRNKNDLPCVFVLVFTVSLLLEPFEGRFINVKDFEVYFSLNMGRLPSLKRTVPVRTSINPIETVLSRQNYR